jgi:hypothetical protein
VSDTLCVQRHSGKDAHPNGTPSFARDRHLLLLFIQSGNFTRAKQTIVYEMYFAKKNEVGHSHRIVFLKAVLTCFLKNPGECPGERNNNPRGCSVPIFEEGVPLDQKGGTKAMPGWGDAERQRSTSR